MTAQVSALILLKPIKRTIWVAAKNSRTVTQDLGWRQFLAVSSVISLRIINFDRFPQT